MSKKEQRKAADAKAAATAAFAKKSPFAAPPMPDKVTLDVGGKKITGKPMKFAPDQEPVITYYLENGARVRFHLLVEDIIVSDELTPAGTPLIATRQGISVSYTPPLGEEK